MRKTTLLKLIFIVSLLVLTTNVCNAQVYDEENMECKITQHWQNAERPMGTPRQLALARIFVSEGGFDGTYDWLAIYQVLLNRSHDRELTLRNMMRYSPKSFNFFREDINRYIPYLNENGDRPLHWRYKNELWESRYKAGWLRAYELAGRLVRGVRIPSTCHGRVDHWGRNRPDMITQALNNGLTLVPCRGTKNLFWRI